MGRQEAFRISPGFRSTWPDPRLWPQMCWLGQGPIIVPMPAPKRRLTEVFVPGGLPRITYNAREELGLERQVKEFLEESGRLLSLSGPTKSGKTVLLKTTVVDAIWISGGDVDSLETFWDLLADRLGAYSDVDVTRTSGESDTMTGGFGGQVVPAGIGLKSDRSHAVGKSSQEASSFRRHRPIAAVAQDALLSSGAPLIIDDFHYIPSDIQQAVIRGLKDPVFQGARVILASVPHRSFDAVKVEREMTGRVRPLSITFWSPDELQEIAHKGFRALNLLPSEGLAKRLADECFRSPHLMQEFCLRVCRQMDLSVEADKPTPVGVTDFTPFFQASAGEMSQAMFDLLARGPRQRADRISRALKNGESVDIYGAILRGIAHTGPLTKLTYEELRSALREIMVQPPQANEVTRVLEEMSKIAKKQEGEPVVDYDADSTTLYISDPFFAYYLRWGVRRSA